MNFRNANWIIDNSKITIPYFQSVKYRQHIPSDNTHGSIATIGTYSNISCPIVIIAIIVNGHEKINVIHEKIRTFLSRKFSIAKPNEQTSSDNQIGVNKIIEKITEMITPVGYFPVFIKLY
ncbi:MAG: hypothetical protein WC071_12965 [Victivallaceae bacterium]